MYPNKGSIKLQFMKKLLLSFILLSFSLLEAQELAAQSFPQPDRRSTGEIASRNPHILKVNILSPFVLTANGAYEHFINPKLSFQLGAFYNGISIEKNFLWFDLPSARYRSYAVTPEVRFYLGHPARTNLDGAYIAPFVRYQSTDIKINADLQQNNNQGDGRTFEGNLSTLRLGVVAGYKFIFNDRINLEIFAGPSIRASQWFEANINTYNAEDFLPFGTWFRSGITLGYGF